MSQKSKDLPRRSAYLIFRIKVGLLRLRRRLTDRQRCKTFLRSPGFTSTHIQELRSPLWTTTDPAELGLEMGKVQNLRIAALALNGIVIPAGETFSFWRHVGIPSKRHGFVEGRALVQGCIVPSVGGGICQLSNALYDLALQCGFEILERHSHSLPVPRSSANSGRDATVAWNYVDLRFRPPYACRLETFLTKGELVVRFQTAEPPLLERTSKGPLKLPLIQNTVGSCETCGLSGCFRHDTVTAQRARSGSSKTAFLLDGVWPEFQKRLLAECPDVCFIPTRAKLLTPPRYAWSLPSNVAVRTAMLPAINRSLHARKNLSPPQLRAQQLKDTQALANTYAKGLKCNETAIVVDSSLLPALDEAGALGGRSVTVWLTQIPLRLLHEHLDKAAHIYPNLPRLSDFRASDDEEGRQWKALESATLIVTPHAYLAQLLKARMKTPVELVPWEIPTISPAETEDEGYVYFSGPTAAREGAIAMRDAARRLNLRLSIGGRNLEDPTFWEGCEILESSTHPMARASVVISGAVLKNRPYECLRAIALGKPLVATPGTGVDADRTVPFGDSDALIEALLSFGRAHLAHQKVDKGS